MIYKLFLFESCRFLLWKYWRKITRIKNCLNLEKQKYLPHYCSNKGLKGTVVNLLCPHLNYNEILKKIIMIIIITTIIMIIIITRMKAIIIPSILVGLHIIYFFWFRCHHPKRFKNNILYILSSLLSTCIYLMLL